MGVVIKSEYRSSLRSKALIRKALLDLIDEKPYDKITITDIVNKAGVNRGTFYSHYSDIDDVLHQIGIGIIDELSSKLCGFDSLSSTFKCISEFLLNDLDFYKKLISLDSVFISKEAKIRSCRAIIEHLEKSGKVVDIALEAKIDYIVSGIIGVYNDILLGNINLRLEDSNSFLASLVEREILA